MFRRLAPVIAVLIAVFALVLVFDNDANATECVPRAAWTETIQHPAKTHTKTVTVTDREAYDEEVFVGWIRYSWTGGPHTEDAAPAEVPPSENWQENVHGDPHGVGKAGPYFRSNGNSGNGDWFYLLAVTKTVHHPAVTHEKTVTVTDKEGWTETIEHEAVTCGTSVDECLIEPELCGGDEGGNPGTDPKDTDNPAKHRTIKQDKNCADIAQKNFKVTSDPYNLDRDNDGVACETVTHRTPREVLPNTGMGDNIALTLLGLALLMGGYALVRSRS